MQTPHAVTKDLPNSADRLLQNAGWARAFMPGNQLRRLCGNSQASLATNPFDSYLCALDVRCDIDERELRHVPVTGPAIVVANHPFGILDGLLLGALLMRIRPDVKMLTNRLLSVVPELHPHCIYVDNLGHRDRHAVNARGLRAAIRFLRSGGLLIVFPAGEVAHWSPRDFRVREPEWSESIARMAALTNATCVPMHIAGNNSAAFQLAGILHPRLRTLRLPHELLNKRGRTVRISAGSPIEPEILRALSSDASAIRLLRWNTYVLSLRQQPSFPVLRFIPPSRQQPLVPRIPAAALSAEIMNASPDCLLEQQGPFDVLALHRSHSPLVVEEIGRLREVTFRAVGEGTGRSTDLDSFDDHYTHIVLWNRDAREIAGAYRVGNTSHILRRFGLRGLYTSTLFRFDPAFFDTIGPALELGRSFVRQEYQKQYAPLLLLWKGIGTYLVRNPETPILFGPVSISNDYSPASREMITACLSARMAPAHLLSMVKAKTPPRHSPESMLQQEIFCKALTLSDISDRVSAFEPDGKGVPILIKHYLKLGARMLGFNVDARFSGVLDGLVMVDLRQADPTLVVKYLGKSGAQDFLDFHLKSSLSPRSA